MILRRHDRAADLAEPAMIERDLGSFVGHHQHLPDDELSSVRAGDPQLRPVHLVLHPLPAARGRSRVTRRHLRVIGLGQPARGATTASGPPWRGALRELRRASTSSSSAGSRLALLEALGDGAEQVVLVDALAPAGRRAASTASTSDAALALEPRTSTHGLGVAEAIELGRALGRLPDELPSTRSRRELRARRTALARCRGGCRRPGRRAVWPATVGRVTQDADAGAWIVEIEGVDEAREPARAALLTLSDGVVGGPCRSGADDGAPESSRRASTRAMDADTALAQLPRWNDVPLEDAVVPDAGCSTFRDGTFRTELDSPRGAVRTLAFASLARPGTAVLVVEGSASRPTATAASPPAG